MALPNGSIEIYHSFNKFKNKTYCFNSCISITQFLSLIYRFQIVQQLFFDNVK